EYEPVIRDQVIVDEVLRAGHVIRLTERLRRGAARDEQPGLHVVRVVAQAILERQVRQRVRTRLERADEPADLLRREPALRDLQRVRERRRTHDELTRDRIPLREIDRRRREDDRGQQTAASLLTVDHEIRSEERRVGRAGRYRGPPYPSPIGE